MTIVQKLALFLAAPSAREQALERAAAELAETVGKALIDKYNAEATAYFLNERLAATIKDLALVRAELSLIKGTAGGVPIGSA